MPSMMKKETKIVSIDAIGGRTVSIKVFAKVSSGSFFRVGTALNDSIKSPGWVGMYLRQKSSSER